MIERYIERDIEDEIPIGFLFNFMVTQGETGSQQWQSDVPLDRGSTKSGSSLPNPVIPAFRLSERNARETLVEPEQ